MTRDRSAKFVLVALLALLPVAPSWAQAPGANISGVVKDPSNTGIGGAQVTATNTATKAVVTGTTDKDGNYTIALPAGSYSVTATLAGFKKVTSAAELAEGASVKLDFSLDAEMSAEITVTARRREESVQDVPLSVAAPTEQELQDRGAQNLEGVAANVGGLTVQNLGPGQSQVAMRGVSSGQIVRDQPGVKEQVGIYLDDSPVSLSLFTPDLDLVDVNHVEVLRGPQGTLFGAGSLSGTVRYITNQPELGRTEGSAEAGLNLIDGGNAGAGGKLVYNMPVGEKAAARVAAYYTHTGGYIDAIQPNLSINDNVNDSDRYGLRAALKWVASDRLTITPRFVYQKVTANGFNRFDAYNILGNPFTTTRPDVDIEEDEQFTQFTEEYDDDFVLGDLNIVYDLGGMSLTSVTSYISRDILVTRDATQLTASITGGSIGLPEAVYTLDAPLLDATTAKVFTEELRLAGGGDRLHWLGGAFFSNVSRDYGQDLPVDRFTALSGIPTQGILAPEDNLFFSRLSYSLDQFALFGEATFDLTNRLSVTGGLRYYSFNEDKEQVFDGLFGNDNNGTSLVSQPGSTNADGIVPGDRQLQAQRHIHAERPDLAGVQTWWRQRPAERSPLHARGPRDLRWSRRVGRRDRLELRARLQVARHEREGHAQRVGLPHGHQQSAGHRDRGLVFVARHLQRARRQQQGHRGRVRRGAQRQLRLPGVRQLQQLRVGLDSDLDRFGRKRDGGLRHRGRQPTSGRSGGSGRGGGDVPVGMEAGIPALHHWHVSYLDRASHRSAIRISAC